MSRYALVLIILTSVLSSGCMGIVVGGAATGAAVVHDRRPSGTVINDHGLKWRVDQALYKDNDLRESSHINTTVYNQVILLTGEVPTEDLKIRANALASTESSNSKVFNEIAIASPTSLISRSNDAYITAKVTTHLLDVNHPQLTDFDVTRVKVTTEAGVVFLMGLLTPLESDVITDIVRSVNGVKKVVRLFEYIDPNSLKESNKTLGSS